MKLHANAALSLVGRRRLVEAIPLVGLALTPAVAQQRVAERGRDTETLAWLSAFDAAYGELLGAGVRIDAEQPTAALHAALR